MIKDEQLKTVIVELWVKIIKATRVVVKDNVSILASGLVFSLLLALIPAITFVISFLSSLGVLDPFLELTRQMAEELLGSNLSKQLLIYVDQFTEDAMSLGIFGAVSFLLTTVLLFNKVYLVINSIYKTQMTKKFVKRLATFSSLLILGVLLLALLLSIETNFLRLFPAFSDTSPSIFMMIINEITLIGTIFLMLVLVITFIPNVKVLWSCSSLGALIGTIGLYITIKLYKILIQFLVSYSIIYGSLAAVLFLLIFLYLFWCIVLISIEFSYLQQFNPDFTQIEYEMAAPARQIIDAFNLLSIISYNFKNCQMPITEGEIVKKIAIKPKMLHYYLALFMDNNVILQTEIDRKKAYSMALPLDRIYVKDMFNIIFDFNDSDNIDTIGQAICEDVFQMSNKSFSNLTVDNLLERI